MELLRNDYLTRLNSYMEGIKMIIFWLIIISIVILTELLIYRNLFSPIVMVNTLFLLIIILAMQRRYGIATFDDRAILLIEFGVIFFDVGVFFIRLILRNVSRVRVYPTRLIFRWKFITLLTLVVTLGNTVTFFYSMNFLLNGGNYIQLRNSLLGYGDVSLGISKINPIISGISSYISAPGLYALLPIAILLFLKKNHIYFSVLIFINLLLNILASGSRIILVYTIVQFLIVMAYENVHISKNVKRFGVIIISAAVIAVVVLSNLRSSNSLFHSFYTYFSAPVVLFSYWMNYADHFNIQSYGLSFFYPVTWVINAIGSLLGVNLESVKNVVEWQSLPQDVWVKVFPMQSMNAFSTMFYFFYEDFRSIGVCIGSFIFGNVAGFVFYRSFFQKSTKYLSIYLLGVKALIGSFMIWQLGSTSFFLSLILLLLCIKKEVLEDNLLIDN